MAYNTQDERLLVKGNAHVKRQLKVDGDIYQEDNKEAVLPNIVSDSIALGDGVVRKIDSNAASGNVTYDATNQKFVTSNDLVLSGNLEANEIKANADVDVQGELIARKDLSVSGDLYVNGTEHINDTETAQTSDDYLVLRHNKTTALGANEHAGIVVHNYMPNKTATLTTDNTGTWRVADNTETDTNYSTISYYNGTYYDGLGQTTSVTVINGIKSAWDEDELDECVFYNNGYYHFDGTNYFTVELSGNVMVLGAMVTDPDVITALEALTGNDLVYYRSLTVTTISEVENEPLLTRDEASNLQENDIFKWDATDRKAVAIPRPTVNGQMLAYKEGTVTFDKHLITVNGIQYIQYPNNPFTETIPSGATATADRIAYLSVNHHVYYSESNNLYYMDYKPEENLPYLELYNIWFENNYWNYRANQYLTELPADAVQVSDLEAYHYVAQTANTYDWKNVDSAPTANSTNPVTSGGVKTAIDDAINALDVTDTAVAGQYVSSVSQVDGEIVVTRDTLPGAVTVDTAMSSTSTNAVQNKVIKTYVDAQVATKSKVTYNSTLGVMTIS